MLVRARPDTFDEYPFLKKSIEIP